MTPHITANPGDFAPDILMPGDPLRARHIAKTLLDDARQVTAVRNVEGYTGTWNGQPISVMASGMGIPSINIYATELFRIYNAQRIIRIGTCGALQETVRLGDIVIGTTCTTDSSISDAYNSNQTVPPPSPALTKRALAAAEDCTATCHAGPIHTSDLFYHPNPATASALKAQEVLAVEMEAAGLYHVAAHEQREALTILTTADLLYSDDQLSTDERESNVDNMTLLALHTLIR